MTESKIVATHRLQKDGRWDEASEYRAEQRLKFRGEGLTKKESNDRAWEAMSLKYPAPDEEGFTHFMALSEFVPNCIDLRASSFFFVYCRVRAVLHLACPTEMAQLGEPIEDRIKVEPQAGFEPPPASFKIVERTNDLLKFAFEQPIDFLEGCSEVFEEAVDDISNEAPAADETRYELLAYSDSIPAMQKIVQERFAGPLCV